MSNLEAEQAVLGGLFLDNTMLDMIDLTPDYFNTYEHKLIYKSILKLNEQNLAFDCMTVQQHLEHDKEDFEGGFSYLMQLQNNTPSGKNVVTYANIVKRHYRNKRLVEVGLTIQRIGEEGGDFDKNLDSALNQFDSFALFNDDNLPDINKVIHSAYSELEVRYTTEGLTGLDTGFSGLNTETHGLQKGELYVFAARPAMGKTTFLLNICRKAVLEGKHVYLASLEMPKERIADKMACDISGVPFQYVKTGNLSDEHFPILSNGYMALTDKAFHVDDTPAQDIGQLKIKLKKLAAKKPFDLIAIDYLQLLRCIKTKNRFDEISEISRQLKDMAKIFNCPVVALSQLNRGLENRFDKRPIMADLRESGQIEQDADMIAFLYRDEVYYPDWSGNENVTEFIISKARFGELGNKKLKSELKFSRFRDLELHEEAKYKPFEKTSTNNGMYDQ